MTPTIGAGARQTQAPTLSSNPADHTDDDIARIAADIPQRFLDAIASDDPDLDSIRESYVLVCRPDEEELSEAIQQLKPVAGMMSFEIVGVERISDDKAWVTSRLTAGGTVTNLEPALIVFQDGRWRDSDCEEGRAATLGDEYTSPTVGTPMVVSPDPYGPSFELVVLGPPDVVDDWTVRLPIRVTAVTDLLDLGYIWPWGQLTTEPDTDGFEGEWPSTDCEIDTFENVLLARGGSHEGFLCFVDDWTSFGIPASEVRFVSFDFMDGEERDVSIDLTEARPLPERQKFTDDVTWTGQIDARIGETISPTSGGEPWVDLTVIGPLETVDETLVRLPVEIAALTRRADVQPDGLPLELATSPDAHGRIHRWYPTTTAEDGSLLPESFGEKSLVQGESQQAFLYFGAPEGQTEPPSRPFVVLRFDGFDFTASIDLTSGN